MPYQKIGTPVFWIDTLQYLRTMGVGGPAYRPSDHVIPQDTNPPYFDWRRREDQSDIFNLNPTSYPSSAEIQYKNDNSAGSIPSLLGINCSAKPFKAPASN